MCVGSVGSSPCTQSPYNDTNPPSSFFVISLNVFPFLKSSRLSVCPFYRRSSAIFKGKWHNTACSKKSCFWKGKNLFFKLPLRIWTNLCYRTVIKTLKNNINLWKMALYESWPWEMDVVPIDIHWTKLWTQHFCFCPHFSWAELKDLRLYLYTQKAYFSQIMFTNLSKSVLVSPSPLPRQSIHLTGVAYQDTDWTAWLLHRCVLGWPQ